MQRTNPCNETAATTGCDHLNSRVKKYTFKKMISTSSHRVATFFNKISYQQRKNCTTTTKENTHRMPTALGSCFQQSVLHQRVDEGRNLPSLKLYRFAKSALRESTFWVRDTENFKQ